MSESCVLDQYVFQEKLFLSGVQTKATRTYLNSFKVVTKQELKELEGTIDVGETPEQIKMRVISEVYPKSNTRFEEIREYTIQLFSISPVVKMQGDVSHAFRNLHLVNISALKNFDVSECQNIEGKFEGNDDLLDVSPIEDWEFHNGLENVVENEEIIDNPDVLRMLGLDTLVTRVECRNIVNRAYMDSTLDM